MMRWIMCLYWFHVPSNPHPSTQVARAGGKTPRLNGESILAHDEVGYIIVRVLLLFLLYTMLIRLQSDHTYNYTNEQTHINAQSHNHTTTRRHKRTRTLQTQHIETHRPTRPTHKPSNPQTRKPKLNETHHQPCYDKYTQEHKTHQRELF